MKLKSIIVLLFIFGYVVIHAQTSPVVRAIKVDTLTTLYTMDGDTSTTARATEEKPYYSLVVTIQQDSTDDPVMTILQNDLPGPHPVLVNESTGWWEIRSTGSFTPGKVHIVGTCSYPTGDYDATGKYPSQAFYNGTTGAKAGSITIIPGNANFIGIMILDASGNPTDLSPFIVIDDISGTYAMPEIRIYK